MQTSILETPSATPRLNVMQVAPGIVPAMLGLNTPVDASGLEPTLLTLVQMRVSQINGCAFCLDMHFREAKQAGETDERLYLLSAWREISLYTPRERAALRWAELLTRLADHAHVTGEDFAAAREEFSEAELACLTLAIVVINGWNRLNVGFRTPPGFYCE